MLIFLNIINMNTVNQIFKYSFRFIFLQTLITAMTIYYFDNFLIPKVSLFPEANGITFRQQIDKNLLEDAIRFFPGIDESFVKIDIVIGLFIFIFLIFLYSTKFYTYVNELSFSLDRSYIDEYFSIYLTWTTSLMVFVTMFRFANLISRGYLLLFTFLIPFVLLIFRNSEFLSTLFGRSVTNEKYITFNLKEDSVFRNLRIMTFRSKIQDFKVNDFTKQDSIIEEIDEINKKNNLNLIVLNFENYDNISKNFEEYLVNLNKKILIISKNEIKFNSIFISRVEEVSGYKLTYFNNDIQYGSKYILKRVLDINLSLLAITILSPIFLFIYLYLYSIDRRPVVIKQIRVGLHGKPFKMYKFRTMKNNAHELRESLKDLNKNDEAIFKLDDDPRILPKAKFIRNFSLDELPQFFNVLKGQMSIVGPRPLFTEDTLLFDKLYMRRLNVLPGITGLLQINERNTSDFKIWYKYDLEYIENWSLFIDLIIILKTPLAIFNKKIKGV